MDLNEAKEILAEHGYTVKNSISEKKRILQSIISFLDMAEKSNLNTAKLEKLFDELLTVTKNKTSYFLDIENKEEAEKIADLLNNAGFHAEVSSNKGKLFGQPTEAYILTIEP